MNIERLPASIQTPDQLQFCADEMRGFVKELVQDGRRKAAGGKHGPLPMLSAPSLDMLSIIPEKQRTDVAVLEQVANQMKDLLQTSPTVHITIAGSPPPVLKTDITEWFRAHTHPNTLVAFHVNPDLAGGMIVRTVNQVHDFSFRTQLLAHSSKIVEVMERV
jgi:hypothetical protein